MIGQDRADYTETALPHKHQSWPTPSGANLLPSPSRCANDAHHE